MAFSWKVKDFLKNNRISVNLLAQQSENRLSRTSIYKFVDNPSGAKVSSLEVVLDSLSEIMGREVPINEIADYNTPKK